MFTVDIKQQYNKSFQRIPKPEGNAEISTFISVIFSFQPLDDQKTLGDVGFTSSTARAQAPATIGLAFKDEGLLKFQVFFFLYLHVPIRNNCLNIYTYIYTCIDNFIP